MKKKPIPYSSTPATPAKKFAWPEDERSISEQQWRKIVDMEIKWLLNDHENGPVYCSDQEKSSWVRALTKSLTKQKPGVSLLGLRLQDFQRSTNPLEKTWAKDLQQAQSHPGDRRYVLSFLAEHIACRENAHHGAVITSRRMGNAHAAHWLNKMMILAWHGTAPPDFFGLHSKNAIIGYGSADAVGAAGRKNYLPWKDYLPWNDEITGGLRQDLEVFLNAFVLARRAHTNKPLWNPKFAQSLVLLRALHLESVEKISHNTAMLLDEMEKTLDMSALEAESVVNYETYTIIRSAADQRILEELVEKLSDEETGGGQNKILESKNQLGQETLGKKSRKRAL